MLSLIDEIHGLLDELATLVGRLDGPTYRWRPNRDFGSVGGHCRHVLDHLEAVVRAEETIDYDVRARDTADEQDPAAALARIAALRGEVEGLRAADPVTPLRLRLRVGGHREGVPQRELEGTSSLARELAFVASHSVHHMATIRSLVEQRGYATASSFGIAPSTLRFRRQPQARG